MYSTPYVFNSPVAKQHPSGTPQSKRTQSFFLMQATFFFFCCILDSVSSIQSPWPSQPSAIGCMIFFLREKERESLCVRVRVCVCVCVFSHESHYVFMLNLHLCLQARQNECNALHNNYIFHKNISLSLSHLCMRTYVLDSKILVLSFCMSECHFLLGFL